MNPTPLTFSREIDFDAVMREVEDGYISVQPHIAADLRIFNYTPRAQFEWRWNNETGNCRGLIVDGKNNIVARPFQKFFSYEQLNGDVPVGEFEVYDKLDGSLGILYWVGDEPFIATRGSFTSDQASLGTQILRAKYGHVKFNRDLTYLFEIIHPSNRIVVDYGGLTDLILLAVVVTETGAELELPDIGFPVPKRFDYRDYDSIRAIKDDQSEGFVIRYPLSGVRVKFKFDEYKRLHRILTQCSNKSIWESLRDGKPLDEILDRVPDEFYQWVKDTKADLECQYAVIEKEASDVFKDFGDRKTNAIYYKSTGVNSSILFSMLDRKDYSQIIWKMIRPKYSKPFKVDEE